MLLIIGCMKSGKSQLLSELFIPEHTILLKPDNDTSTEFSRSGAELPILTIKNNDGEGILKAVKNFPVVMVDEAQLFESKALEHALKELYKTKKVIIASLNAMFDDSAWETTEMIQKKFNPQTIHLTARCDEKNCTERATKNFYEGVYTGIDTDKSKYKVFCKEHYLQKRKLQQN